MGKSYEQILRDMQAGKFDSKGSGAQEKPVEKPEASVPENKERVTLEKESELVEEIVPEKASDKPPEIIEEPEEASALPKAQDEGPPENREEPAIKESVAQEPEVQEPVSVSLEEVPVEDEKEVPAPKPYSPEAEKAKADAVRKKGQAGRNRSSDSTDCKVRIPAELVAMCRGQVPEALNNSDAVAAWLYAKSDKTVDVPEYIKKISLSYVGDQTTNILKDINENLAAMRQQNYRLGLLTDGRVQELWYMVGYLMLERMDEIHSPSLPKLDLAIPVFDTLRDTLRTQFAKERNRLTNGKKNRYRKP